MHTDLPEDRRQAIFAALVAAQDEGESVSASRNSVAAKYEITPEQVQEIEKEGLQSQWPPL